MTDRARLSFVDTNILIYSFDATHQKKCMQARELLADLWETGAGRLSTQVLNEFFVITTRKLSPGLTNEEAWSVVQSYSSWRPLAISYELQEAAFELYAHYSLSWWDSLLLASANFLNCDVFFSEDLQHGLRVHDVEIVNPLLDED